jgi:hypothetical protein
MVRRSRIKPEGGIVLIIGALHAFHAVMLLLCGTLPIHA